MEGGGTAGGTCARLAGGTRDGGQAESKRFDSKDSEWQRGPREPGGPLRSKEIRVGLARGVTYRYSCIRVQAKVRQAASDACCFTLSLFSLCG